MDAHEALAENVQLLRAQVGLSQSAVAEVLHVDATAILKIEKGTRRVRVDELLLLADALHAHPGQLLVPPDGDTLRVGDLEVDAAQVLAWFAGDTSALVKPQRDRAYFADRGRLSADAQELLEDLDAMTRAMDADDDQSVLHWAVSLVEKATRMAHWAHRRAQNLEDARRAITYYVLGSDGPGREN